MDSDDDFELFPSSPIILPQPKLKRLKKAASLIVPSINSSDESESLRSDSTLEELTLRSVPNHEILSPLPNKHGSGAARVLDFNSVAEELDVNVESPEIEKDKVEEVADLKSHELERKRRILDNSAENTKKKRKKIIDDGGAENIGKESASNKRKAEKERRENLKQLRAESQRLLRETRDAAFKPIPLVQKPISSILDKIRQRKLEILKKSISSYVDTDDSEHCLDEEIIDKSEEVKLEVTPTSPSPTNNEDISDKVEDIELKITPTCPIPAKSDVVTSHLDGSNDVVGDLSCESIPPPVGMDSESDHTFRAPIGDTQELYFDSESSDAKDEAVTEKPSNPSKESDESSMFAMNLHFDSAPPDDDVSSDDEDYDKENVDPLLHGSVLVPSSPSGDPVKAYVDEEAEEEDDSDNDIQHFQDNEDEGDDDIEDLKDLIATGFEEKSTDREKRDQLHQHWLEQQDTVGMDNILQKLNCGSKFKESSSVEEEGDDESNETDTENEFDDEAEDFIAPSDSVKINLKKMKQMMPQMFTDKDDAYVSSDDDETEMKLAKQCLFDKAEDKATFLSPAEDESSREVFSRIKKLNVVPDAKRKGRTSSTVDMMRIGQSINISSKSSFVGRASNHFMHSSHKSGSSKVRSFIFERDDSNSRTSISMSDDSPDTIQRESQVPKTFSAKFQRNTQNKYTALDSASQKSSVSLLEILRKSSIHAKHSVQHAEAQQQESVFDAFKLAKKPSRT
ncbi:hypothetical protein Lalb_Chr23g0266641 [Lupinus albus]|uniref:DNA replication checkpoint mediator MRC1 domain-containing protein n=1 Tax=Lupinus albus TaxID=3870 RepID=A0A6A4N9Z0_LUPAL|nr:hypothetical protein Lalb_Chr23g0266641 [Lupinus albus]